MTPNKDEPRVISNWTIDSLYTHLQRVISDLDQRTIEHFRANELRYESYGESIKTAIAAVEKAAVVAMASSEKAITKSEAASEARFSSVNEFRSAMNDQQRVYIPRTEVDQRVNALADKINDVGTRVDRIEAKGQGMQSSWSVVVAVISVIILIIGVIIAFLRH